MNPYPAEQSVKAYIYYDGKHYCVRCSPIDVFTQGKTLDETVKNVREAVALHLEDETNRKGLPKNPPILILMETTLQRVA
ncbi:MAG: type II toxin-antitoxin system HicB family antitoxin [Elusimicrobia bacterium]|nr:type II toxin-antitoxin system HicB family antitoxin [Elusimicrobiota bacterium]